jgi:hypothetical protein
LHKNYWIGFLGEYDNAPPTNLKTPEMANIYDHVYMDSSDREISKCAFEAFRGLGLI